MAFPLTAKSSIGSPTIHVNVLNPTAGMLSGPVDGHDIDVMDRAIAEAKQSQDKPTLIIARTVIGKGSPNRQGTSKVHGEALGEEELKLTREALGWKWDPFVIPQEIYDAMNAREAGQKLQKRL